MSENLISIKAFLGKYYSELLYSAGQDKYKNTGLDLFFEQRFLIQNNKVQIIIDPSITGLNITVSGNELTISKELYDHPNVTISNSLENVQATNPKSLYNSETFPTLAYLICQNHTTIEIVGEIDEPIYVKYKSDYETFYSSVLVFNIFDNIDVEIVEEIESFSALNAVTNYIIGTNSKLNLTTFYQNHITALSLCYRNVIARDNSSFNHVLLGKGSTFIIDENRIHAMSGSKTEMLGIINSDGKNFNSILRVEPGATDYTVSVKYKDILHGKANVSFYPIIIGQVPVGDSATIEVSNILLDEIPDDRREAEIKAYVSDIIDRTILGRMAGVKRFYDNKSKFLYFYK